MSCPARCDAPLVTAGAAEVRAALGLTTHQLSEFTPALHLDVGPRPNYPRFGHVAIHLMTAAQALRAVRVPLETALRAACSYKAGVLTGVGWMVCAPTGQGWLTSLVVGVEDLTGWIATVDGRGVVVDLTVVADRTAATWQKLTTEIPAPRRTERLAEVP